MVGLFISCYSMVMVHNGGKEDRADKNQEQALTTCSPGAHGYFISTISWKPPKPLHKESLRLTI